MSAMDDHSFTPPDTGQSSEQKHGEYVFRFRVQPSSGNAAYDDPLIELIRGQLADLLDSVILTDHGRRVRVDGFRLLQDPETQHHIFPQGGASGQHKLSE